MSTRLRQAPAIPAMPRRRGRTRWTLLPAAIPLIVILGAFPASAQMPQPAPAAPPDTARAVCESPTGIPDSWMLTVRPDTVAFGGRVHLVWERDAAVDSASVPVPDVAWLVPVVAEPGSWWRRLLGRDGTRPVVAADLPRSQGTRIVNSYHVYRTDPFRVSWQDEDSPVVTVRGRVADANQVVSIRDPRSLERLTWRVALVAALAIGLAWLIYRWWRRRTRLADIEHWEPAPPAWPEAAVALAALLHDGTLDRGDGAAFLDGLALVVRRFVAGRYGVAAREMTGREIVAACSGLGYGAGHPGGFARLVDEADRRRYDPEPPAADWCREQAVQFFGRLDRVRVLPGPGRVSAEVLESADRAWAQLVRELGTGAGRLPREIATVRGE